MLQLERFLELLEIDLHCTALVGRSEQEINYLSAVSSVNMCGLDVLP
jgi:hypothetical protein